MQINIRVLGSVTGLIAAALLIVGFAIVRPVLAQEESKSTGQIAVTPSVEAESAPAPAESMAPVESTDVSPHTETGRTGDESTSTRYYAHVTDGIVVNLLVDPNHIIPTGALGDPATWILASADVGIGYTYSEGIFEPSESQKVPVFISSTSTSPQVL